MYQTCSYAQIPLAFWQRVVTRDDRDQGGEFLFHIYSVASTAQRLPAVSYLQHLFDESDVMATGPVGFCAVASLIF